LWRRVVGRGGAPGESPVRLGVAPSLNFSPTAVTKYQPETADTPAELSVSFTGLIGPNGVLPQHYTAQVMARHRAKDHTLRQFLDLFHHRILTLLYEAWLKNRLPLAVERDVRSDSDDEGSRILWALAGVGSPGLRNRTAFDDDAFVYFSGLFSRITPTAVGMEAILSTFFGWPVHVEQYSGRWLYLDLENLAQLPMSQPQGGLGQMGPQLGRTAVPGRRVWDAQGKLRLRVGPVGAKAFASLLPGGAAHKAFGELARAYAGLEFDIDVQIVLEPDAVPWSELTHDEDRRPQLGRNCWVRAHNFGRPTGDAIFAVGG